VHPVCLPAHTVMSSQATDLLDHVCIAFGETESKSAPTSPTCSDMRLLRCGETTSLTAARSSIDYHLISFSGAGVCSAVEEWATSNRWSDRWRTRGRVVSSLRPVWFMVTVERGLPCASKTRATRFLCLAGTSARSSVAASISPQRTAVWYSTIASERPWV